MSWLTNIVRPKIRSLITSQREVPDNMWHKCPGCDQMVFHRDLAANLNVCTHCTHHMRIGAKERLENLFDNGKYTNINLPEAVHDPLKFKDRKRYGERLKETRAKYKDQKDAILVGVGKINNTPTVIAAFDFFFMGGSMGAAVGAALVEAARVAVKEKAALIVIPSSGGARMQEGILSLMQMPRTTVASEMVKNAKLPYIVVLADPTTGGVTASFAMLGDITLAEPGAIIGFAGARVIKQTIRADLPDGFQKSEYLLEHGMVDRVVKRHDLKKELSTIINLLTHQKSDQAA